ncbi:MAG: hypothetical protein GWO20_12510 [Candidatus Korarchaeota archaeon]|nr:hypothetical protein [Candidatus Korarchaeota archaeon]NIU84243.1 hypothetical protein [Candidatus Thorarchaeota archaeon]NIW14406.1 hypothetical protein [Candidatus Thorarchaeota archaeon]NIW52475.1 hypothetical protein [Candidatus Korarchaeota archaeon]
MSLSSDIAALLSKEDIKKLEELLSMNRREVLNSIKKSWKSRMYALFLLRLSNFKNKKWRILQYDTKDQPLDALIDALEVRSLNVSKRVNQIDPTIDGNCVYLLGTISLKDMLHFNSTIGWKGKWEAILFEKFRVLICDELGEQEIERKKENLEKKGLEIGRKRVNSRKIGKIRESLTEMGKSLRWRKLWVGEGVFDAGVQTLTVEGEEGENLEDAARHLASKADGFNPGFASDGAEIGWKVGENYLMLSRERGEFKTEISAENLEMLLTILEQI